MMRSVSRRQAAALLLILATIVLVIGTSAERSLAGATTPAHPAESAGTVSGEGSEGGGEAAEGHSEEGAEKEAESQAEQATTPHDEAREATETILGINPESTGAIAAVVVISLLLAAALWLSGTAGVLIVAAIFALLVAALDLREVMHQLSESRMSLAAIALVAAILHGGVAVLAGLSLTQRPSSVA
jgi:hypothetical protein